jgi:putative sterol carrier protein
MSDEQRAAASEGRQNGAEGASGKASTEAGSGAAGADPREFARGLAADTAQVDPQEFARAIAMASDEQIREGLDGPIREQALGEIFRRMEEHFDPGQARDLDAVIHWRIGDRPDGGHDEYEVAIRDGSCTVREGLASEPRVAFQLGAVEFLRLVTGNANGPVLFMRGKLKIEGDLMFAARVQSLFRIPS